MYKRCFALKKDFEFRRAYGRGKNSVSAGLVLYCFKTKLGMIRIGITTGKKVGNAVLRNRARRVIRESIRHIEPELRGSWDIVVVARTRTPSMKSQSVEKELRLALSEMGIINKEMKQR